MGRKLYNEGQVVYPEFIMNDAVKEPITIESRGDAQIKSDQGFVYDAKESAYVREYKGTRNIIVVPQMTYNRLEIGNYSVFAKIKVVFDSDNYKTTLSYPEISHGPQNSITNIENVVYPNKITYIHLYDINIGIVGMGRFGTGQNTTYRNGNRIPDEDVETLTVKTIFYGFYIVKKEDIEGYDVDEIKKKLDYSQSSCTVGIDGDYDKKMKFVGELQDSITLMPDYHRTAIKNYIQEVVSEADNDFVFPMITDTHMDADEDLWKPSVYGLMCCNEVFKSGISDLLVIGGDIANTNGTEKDISKATFDFVLSKLLTATSDSFGRRLIVKGNHELPKFISKQKFSNISDGKLNLNVVKNEADADGNYGYIDFVTQKIRLIYLDTSRIDYKGTADDVQFFWLGDVALNMSDKSGWMVLIIAHEPLYDFYLGYGNDWYNTPCYRQLLSAFHRGNDINLFAHNFTFTQQGAVPMVYICGHSHFDKSFIDASQSHDFLAITMSDSSTARDTMPRSASITGDTYPHKTYIGTIKEVSFDTFFIDPVNHIVRTKRYGYGENREFKFD